MRVHTAWLHEVLVMLLSRRSPHPRSLCIAFCLPEPSPSTFCSMRRRRVTSNLNCPLRPSSSHESSSRHFHVHRRSSSLLFASRNILKINIIIIIPFLMISAISPPEPPCWTYRPVPFEPHHHIHLGIRLQFTHPSFCQLPATTLSSKPSTDPTDLMP